MGITIPNNGLASSDGTMHNNNIGRDSQKPGTMISGNENMSREENPENLNTLVGFLVSFSRTEVGEYWVLREGNNTIGKVQDVNIKLNEETVSDKHGTLNITRNELDNRFDVVFVDTLSTNGSFLNGKKILPYTGTMAKNEDKLKIGNYEFKLIIVDKFLEGLKKSEAFKELIDFDYSSRNFGTGFTKAYNQT